MKRISALSLGSILTLLATFTLLPNPPAQAAVALTPGVVATPHCVGASVDHSLYHPGQDVSITPTNGCPSYIRVSNGAPWVIDDKFNQVVFNNNQAESAAFRIRDHRPIKSGIEGTVFMSPVCPVLRPGMNCSDRPVQATVVAQNIRTGAETRTTSKANGHFLLYLAPGDYRVYPLSSQSLKWNTPQTVHVWGGHFTSVLLIVDTGIRNPLSISSK
jgi:hypothetical protein